MKVREKQEKDERMKRAKTRREGHAPGKCKHWYPRGVVRGYPYGAGHPI